METEMATAAEGKRERYIPAPGTYEPAITLKDVCISYSTMQKTSIKQSLRKGGRPQKEYFEAVRGASFEIQTPSAAPSEM